MSQALPGVANATLGRFRLVLKTTRTSFGLRRKIAEIQNVADATKQLLSVVFISRNGHAESSKAAKTKA
jgi:hypothetical protein